MEKAADLFMSTGKVVVSVHHHADRIMSYAAVNVPVKIIDMTTVAGMVEVAVLEPVAVALAQDVHPMSVVAVTVNIRIGPMKNEEALDRMMTEKVVTVTEQAQATMRTGDTLQEVMTTD